MSDLIEDIAGGNAPEFTVSELSGAVKRTIEGSFDHVRVRGEVGRVSRPRSGHVYLDLKDDRACLAGVIWKGQAARLETMPEEGMEVIATGRLTTFPGQSKYQIVIETIAPAGLGALMAMLEKRRAALQAEGLFAPERKRPLPFLPEVIGVVTSPSGAVIRDILHRLRDRFPRRVLIWPVAVQGQSCAPEVARAIAGFNALAPRGPIPRPDLLIVARGGGSIEDLWGFNEEAVVRAAAASQIPLISAVGHETDTTLIDHAADRRAPTPTAAAEMAVPVRRELIAWADGQGARLSRALAQGFGTRGQRLRDLSRALPRPDTLTQTPRQRLDWASQRLPAALRAVVTRRRAELQAAGSVLRPSTLKARNDRCHDRLETLQRRLGSAVANGERLRRRELERCAARLRPQGLVRQRDRTRLRLEEALRRLSRIAATRTAEQRTRLEALDRMRESLGYEATLGRGFAVVWSGDEVLTEAAAARAATTLRVQFRDGDVTVAPEGAARPKRRPGRKPPAQGSLF
ncbi:exodeoxyribonuclease VII large subunit [Roseitranquillus sediminis]|uniref:exodeoxyribonuclease VII large subunit n=1 Tax=Roseitranquillus sediminis TaxID=2809051 RepID=UPI001D0CB378|nr:exodeoxyribonuclease VII large subunit [Roseitranquillus sediminis]MBM9594654.1 exodeoxyribonuclease VII large subunit [Roseitranquillus sediminis]